MKRILTILGLITMLFVLTACGGPDVEVTIKEGDPILGDPNAPVIITEFSDFECPFCGRAARDVLPQLKEEYIDTGKVALVFKDYPLPGHRYALPAAQAAQCAYQQDSFWEYHDILFENQGELHKTALFDYAESLGLNMTEFDACYTHSQIKAGIQLDQQEGNAKGITGTPTFVFNDGTTLVGAQPYTTFKEAIERRLVEE